MLRDQDCAPLSSTSERADTLHRLRANEEGSGLPGAILSERSEQSNAERASNTAQRGATPSP
jgi:hypothetical protein